MLALAAVGQERVPRGMAKEMSFFEYLGAMVEEDGKFIDPLDMENMDLAKPTESPAVEEAPDEREEAAKSEPGLQEVKE